jgi:glucosamine kinase
MSYWIGIDGGGSTLRVALTSDDLTIRAQSQDETVNPSVVGRERASTRIQTAIRDVLAQADLTAADVNGIGIGVAGASVAHSETWLRETLAAVLPDTPIAPSSDAEIALVGALGERQGVLILAGTGSVAYGVNSVGQSLQIGGWGYLLGDEGSSYWIGMKALQALTRAADGREADFAALRNHLFTTLDLSKEADLIPWLYHAEQPRTRQIAQLAPLLLDAAANGFPVAVQIAESAADELALLCRTVSARLHMDNPRIAFAGGLLDRDNFLSDRLCLLLSLGERPQPLYPPVIGAALLVQMLLKGHVD